MMRRRVSANSFATIVTRKEKGRDELQRLERNEGEARRRRSGIVVI